VKVRRAARPAGQDEALERLEPLVHLVDVAFEPVDLRRDDAQAQVGRGEIVAGSREIRAEVEQFVLDRCQKRSNSRIVDREERDSDRAIGFVDVADRLT
jgi:hypothetical protein